MLKKALRAILFVLPLVSGLYIAFVLMNLWDWFVAPSFHLSEISFWMMYGLTLIVYVFRHTASWEAESVWRHKEITVMLNACVQSEQRSEMANVLKEMQEDISEWRRAGLEHAGRIFAATLALGLGFRNSHTDFMIRRHLVSCQAELTGAFS